MKLALQIQTNTGAQRFDVPGPRLPSDSNPSGIVQWVIGILFIVAIIIALFSLIYAGVKWTISEGKKDAIEKAHNQILFSVIGLVIVFLAFFIVNTLGGFFGINLF